MIKGKMHIKELLEKVKKTYACLSREKRRKLDEEQRRSWVVSELMISFPTMTKDRAEYLYDEALKKEIAAIGKI